MAKGKRTYIAYYSTSTGNIVHITHIQKKNFEAGIKGPNLTRYNKVTKKRESIKNGGLKIKEIKKG